MKLKVNQLSLPIRFSLPQNLPLSVSAGEVSHLMAERLESLSGSTGCLHCP